MATTQFNVRLPVAIAERLRKAAAERHTMPGALVAQAVEQFLAPDSGAQKLLSADSGLEDRLAAIEKRLAYLERRPPLRSPPPSASAAASPAVAAEAPTPPPTKRAALPQSGEALTTSKMAAALGIKRGTLNERIRRAGGAREGLEVAGWVVVGQAVPPMGGPAQWLWRAADSKS